METPNLDALLDEVSPEFRFQRASVKELAALKQRAADLELMLRAAMLGIAFGRDGKTLTAVEVLAEDPLITDAARATLRELVR